MITWLVLTGGLAGLGLALFVAELRPAPPQLGSALDRLHPDPVLPGEAAAGVAPTGFYEALGARLRRLPGVTIPQRELALVGRTPERHLAQKLLSALIGLVAFPYVGFVASLAGVSLPVLVPAVCSLALGALMWFLPDLLLRAQAAEARVDHLHAIASYLELVALERAGDRGPAEALISAARVGNGPVLLRIAAALDRALLERRPPWDGLADLATELGLTPLQDLADTMRLAGTDGAAVYKTLRARAANLRAELLSDELAKANAVSERMVLPGTGLVMVFTILVGFPAVSRMM
ncbi:type II secretion system F family protein [Streptacidiphilus jiangxiensis]|uniref:Type II secretion system (T2SS), protein F n=1 Tax=Streptacidiphilus jiangxiensis TaxID=235985 RepID=A0A1H7T661_STRJI|nr:type II secretion system F family protein [Streptacidiphilus jiangxiensis]SEL80228.1 Type II secretion system (T2SS), protein F [Streptacidiphilus jiangxiensis]